MSYTLSDVPLIIYTLNIFAICVFFVFRGHQFSIALKLTHDECKNGDAGRLNRVDFDRVRQTMLRGEIYNNDVITAALPGGAPYMFSEQRVLGSVKTANVQCLIFYTQNCPCTEQCPGNVESIAGIAEQTFNSEDLLNGFKAFVFGEIYYQDVQFISRESMYNKLRKIRGPEIYCCFGELKCHKIEFDKDNSYARNHYCLQSLHTEAELPHISSY